MRQPLTRAAISEAARDILVAEGLHAVSLRRVAGGLGVTAPALYAHVADKRDLLQGIAEQEVQTLLAGFERERGEGVERLRSICQSYIDYGVKNPDLFRAIFLFRPELTSEGRGGDKPLTTLIHEAFVGAARSAADQNGFADGIDPELAGLSAWTAAHGVVTVLLSGPPLDIEVQGRLADATVNAALAGLRRDAWAAA